MLKETLLYWGTQVLTRARTCTDVWLHVLNETGVLIGRGEGFYKEDDSECIVIIFTEQGPPTLVDTSYGIRLFDWTGRTGFRGVLYRSISTKFIPPPLLEVARQSFPTSHPARTFSREPAYIYK